MGGRGGPLARDGERRRVLACTRRGWARSPRHHAGEMDTVVVSLLAGGSGRGEVRQLLAQVAAALPGFDVGVRVRIITPWPSAIAGRRRGAARCCRSVGGPGRPRWGPARRPAAGAAGRVARRGGGGLAVLPLPAGASAPGATRVVPSPRRVPGPRPRRAPAAGERRRRPGRPGTRWPATRSSSGRRCSPGWSPCTPGPRPRAPPPPGLLRPPCSPSGRCSATSANPRPRCVKPHSYLDAARDNAGVTASGNSDSAGLDLPAHIAKVRTEYGDDFVPRANAGRGSIPAQRLCRQHVP